VPQKKETESKPQKVKKRVAVCGGDSRHCTQHRLKNKKKNRKPFFWGTDKKHIFLRAHKIKK